MGRQVVPRWRPWRISALLGEAEMPRRTTIDNVDGDPLKNLFEEYRENPSIGIAGDLLSAAVTIGDSRPEILSIAKELQHLSEFPVQVKMCEDISARDERRERRRFNVKPDAGRERIRKLRKSLNREPRNALSWVDLALEYLVVGQPEKAMTSMTIALNLAAEDRFVLRSACALFVERGELDRALTLLQRSSRAKSDPWLVAPQVAIADLAKEKLNIARTARQVLKADHPAAHLAELRAAFGTVELSAGSRRGRQLLRGILEGPTENALAQVEWSDRRTNETGSLIGDMPSGVPRAFEALALRASFEAQWIEGWKLSESWRDDQPFRVEPYVQGSYCASAAGEWDEALAIGMQGLSLHPHDSYLLNNVAFSYIGLGDLPQAAAVLLKARSAKSEEIGRLTQIATEAQWLFRVGEVEEGRIRYNAAIRLFERKHRIEEAARAALMLAQEEIFAGSTEADRAFKRASDFAEKAKHFPSVRDLQARVEGVKQSSPVTKALSTGTVGKAVVLVAEKKEILKPPQIEAGLTV